MRPTALVIGIVVLLTMFCPQSLSAQTDSSARREFSVRVHAPPACVDSSRFAALVVKRTERAAPRPPQASIHFAVTIDEAMDGATGTITTIRSSRSRPDERLPSRNVKAATCREAAEALALIAAVVLDPEAATTDSSPTPATVQPAAPEPPLAAPATTPTQDSTTPPEKPSEWRIGPGIAALFSGGVGPGVSTGFNAFVGLTEIPPSTGWALDARLSFAMTQASSVTTEAGHADFNWWAAGLAVCPFRFQPAIFRNTFAIEPCAGFEGGLLKGSGSQTVSPATSAGVWLAASAGVRAAWSLAPFFQIQIEGDLVIPFQRDRFFFAPDFTAYKVPAVTGRGTIGIALLF